MINVEFPAMRDEVISALRSLADPQHQLVRWGVSEPGVDYYDDLTLNVHVLYDDCKVLPDPSTTVGDVIVQGEVPALRALHEVLGPLLDGLGDSPDSEYISNSKWPSVVTAAQNALDAMRRSE
jgi:hypothetical protein